MLRAPRRCTNCRKTFLENSSERNYENYRRYGFKTRDAFEKHVSTNAKCPCKVAIIPAGGEVIQKPIPIWLPYKHPDNVRTENDYTDEQRILEITLERYERKVSCGQKKQLWFETTKNTAWDIVAQTLDPDIQYMTLVAQPGSGKTMVIHYTIYLLISSLMRSDSRHPDNITLTCGMADISWYDQTLDNLTLNDETSKDYLWKSLNDVKNNHCLVHRANLHKRITYLLQHIELMSNHVFIVDESNFADSEEMTMDEQLTRLGLTSERMRSYNIKVILVSATPDVNMSIMQGSMTHKQVVLREGKGYRGFKFYNEEGMIKDYNKNIGNNIQNLERLIMSKWSSPRWHFYRVSSSQKNNDRTDIMTMAHIHGWEVVCVDSNHSNKIANNLSEYKNLGISAHRTFLEPPKHTIVILLGKYRASKRLTLTPFIGLVAEYAAKLQNTTVTCNGLIPRFFGYPGVQSFINNENPLFLCNIKCVEEYIRFTDIPEGDPWTYENNDYTALRIKSNSQKTAELKSTCYSKLEGLVPSVRYTSLGSKPILSIDVDKDTLNDIIAKTGKGKISAVKKIMETKHPTNYREYQTYGWQVWTVETQSKLEHYGLSRLAPDSKSHEGQVTRKEEHEDDIIRVYAVTHDKPRLIAVPWNGSATK